MPAAGFILAEGIADGGRGAEFVWHGSWHRAGDGIGVCAGEIPRSCQCTGCCSPEFAEGYYADRHGPFDSPGECGRGEASAFRRGSGFAAFARESRGTATEG